jgi:hypothetical protein
MFYISPFLMYGFNILILLINIDTIYYIYKKYNNGIAYEEVKDKLGFCKDSLCKPRY